MTFDAARSVIRDALAERAFPAAVIEVGVSHEPVWREAFGRLTFDSDSARAADDTVFDLASLTKVLATAPLIMRHVERGTLGLDEPVARRFPRWQGPVRAPVTVRDLLAHCGGLPAHRPFYEKHRGRNAYEQAICETPLEYAPRSKSVYSDLGFMMLGFILEDVSALAVQFDAMRQQMIETSLAVSGASRPAWEIQFHPPETWKRRTAPTRQSKLRGRLLIGEVDDDNTWALGGAAGQAGLFGTAEAVGACARHVLQVLGGRAGAFERTTLREFITRRADVPGSSRALGWDTMLPTSSCGTRISPRAFGHTGFTGTSLWIDPERDAYVVLLTNRVHPTPANEAIFAVRRALHDAVFGKWEPR